MVFVSFDQEIFVIYKINVNNLKDNSLPLLKKATKVHENSFDFKELRKYFDNLQESFCVIVWNLVFFRKFTEFKNTCPECETSGSFFKSDFQITSINFFNIINTVLYTFFFWFTLLNFCNTTNIHSSIKPFNFSYYNF